MCAANNYAGLKRFGCGAGVVERETGALPSLFSAAERIDCRLIVGLCGYAQGVLG